MKTDQLIEPGAKLYDDCTERSLVEFTRDALGHERFESIDRVESQGLYLTGKFHGKIERLDIGQA